jgi:phosphocarrier protein FPr
MAERNAELDHLHTVLSSAQAELQELSATVASRAGLAEGAVFEAQALFLEDPAITEPLYAAVQDAGLPSPAAVTQVFEEAARELETLDDPYLSARAADVRDVGARLIRLLNGDETPSLQNGGEDVVIIARDLTPSDTVGLHLDRVRGIILVEGTPTAHATILARGLGLPLVLGVGSEAWTIQPGQDVLLDGASGTILVEPDEHEREIWDQPVVPLSTDGSSSVLTTHDGRPILLMANASTPAEAGLAMKYGAKGIGLLRTEFLLASLSRERSEAPDEDALADAYGAIFQLMTGRPVVVRAMDAGGDKPLPFLDFGDEANPFMGWRGIRILLDRPELFALQTRAVLRAAVSHGTDLRLMFPMITSVDEFVRARSLVEAVLRDGRFPLSHPVQIGAMIEVPAAALTAKELAREVDFFSIGTNDLIQYTLASDRGNSRVSRLCDVSHPAVLRLIDMTVTAAHSAKLPVAVCGEAAGDPASIPLLLDLGVDELSVGPARVPEVRERVQSILDV